MTKRYKLLMAIRSMHYRIVLDKPTDKEFNIIRKLTKRINGSKRPKRSKSIQIEIPGTEKARWDDQTPFRSGAT